VIRSGNSDFAAVNDVFEGVLRRTNGGAAFCAIVDGEIVVNLLGGATDRASTRVWEPRTATTLFSGSKGLVTMCLALLVERGLLDLNAPVCHYWPEFASHGKEKITVLDIATHRAGLAALSHIPSLRDLVDPEATATALADQEPYEPFVGVPCYHALTFGWLCGELIGRIINEPFSSYFSREIADAVGADVHFGLPQAGQGRVASVFPGAGVGDPVQGVSLANADYARRTYGRQDLWAPDTYAWNLPEVRSASIPGAGAIGTAVGMARCYAAFAGGINGQPALVTDATLEMFTREQYAVVDDPVSDYPLRYGVGFALQTSPQMWFGPPADAFGHSGAGGSSHGWWPSQRVAFSFVMNEMLPEDDDDRARGLLEALYHSL
jgi:CubicO group peptidase (beta-lactamase class C family)